MRKNSITVAFIGEPSHSISRDRAAYLVRAARSRRRDNVRRVWGHLLCRDSNFIISKGPMLPV